MENIVKSQIFVEYLQLEDFWKNLKVDRRPRIFNVILLFSILELIIYKLKNQRQIKSYKYQRKV